jgi:hypothetical protein
MLEQMQRQHHARDARRELRAGLEPAFEPQQHVDHSLHEPAHEEPAGPG